MFILELTLRSWNHSEENKRRTLQRNDIAAAITRTDIFDFLVSMCSQHVALVHMPVCAACKQACAVRQILSSNRCAAGGYCSQRRT